MYWNVTTNRIGFPRCLVSKKNTTQRGKSVKLNNGKVAFLVWQDKRPVYFVSSIFISDADENVLRYDPNVHKRVQVQCPKIVTEYNKFMGGTDKNDQMTKLNKCRRHYKWPRRLMIKFFMWACYNSYVLIGYKRPHQMRGKRTLTFNMYMEQLCQQLVAQHEEGRNKIGDRRLSADDLFEQRLQNLGIHGVEKAPHATSNNVCCVCYERHVRAKKQNSTLAYKDLPPKKKTMYWCPSCQKFLCIGLPEANCWKDWHSKIEYWK